MSGDPRRRRPRDPAPRTRPGAAPPPGRSAARPRGRVPLARAARQPAPPRGSAILARPFQEMCGVDQRYVSERLGEVPEELARARIDLFAVQPDVVRVPEHALEDAFAALDVAREDQRIREPEGADREYALAARQAVRVDIPVDELLVLARQLPERRLDRALHPRMVVREEADDPDLQVGRVEGVRVVVLDERLLRLA